VPCGTRIRRGGRRIHPNGNLVDNELPNSAASRATTVDRRDEHDSEKRHRRPVSSRKTPGDPRSIIGFDTTTTDRYCENMKNITVSVDDDTYRRARIKAAERDTSVSALVKQYLTELAAEASDPERLLQQERELRARVKNFSASDRLPRDELYDRRR
jgi:plasmid stability protein